MPASFLERLLSPPAVNRSLPNWLVASLGAVWLAGVVAGSCYVWDHASTPADSTAPPVQWPGESTLPRQPGRTTLVLFAHPQCPCTVATLRELERMLPRTDGKLDTVVAFLQPTDSRDDWTQSRNWKLSQAIPQVSTVVDHDGIEAARFCANASGEARLYDESGRLQFHGGLTSARAHEGESAGRAAVLSLVSGKPAATNCSPVFGCSLFSPAGEDE